MARCSQKGFSVSGAGCGGAVGGVNDRIGDRRICRELVGCGQGSGLGGDLGREPKPGAPDRRWDSQPLSAELPWMAALLCHAAGAHTHRSPPFARAAPPHPRCPSTIGQATSASFGDFFPIFPSCSTRRSMFHVKRRDPAVALPYVHVDVVTGAQSGAAPDRDSETRARLGPPGVRQRQAVTVPGPHAHGALRGPRGQIDPAAVGGKRALRPWTDVACRERDSGDPKLAAPRQRCSCPCKLSSAITAHPSQSWRSGGVRLLPSPTFSDCISKRNQAIKPSCRNPRSRSRHHTRADVLMVGECGVLSPAGIPIIGVPAGFH